MNGAGVGSTAGFGWRPSAQRPNSNPLTGAAIPTCVSAERRQVAETDCAAAMKRWSDVRGIGFGMGAKDPFDGADPCWVAQLPICRTFTLFKPQVPSVERPPIEAPSLKPLAPEDAALTEEGWTTGDYLKVGGLLLLLAAAGYGTYRVVKK